MKSNLITIFINDKFVHMKSKKYKENIAFFSLFGLEEAFFVSAISEFKTYRLLSDKN